MPRDRLGAPAPDHSAAAPAKATTPAPAPAAAPAASSDDPLLADDGDDEDLLTDTDDSPPPSPRFGGNGAAAAAHAHAEGAAMPMRGPGGSSRSCAEAAAGAAGAPAGAVGAIAAQLRGGAGEIEDQGCDEDDSARVEPRDQQRPWGQQWGGKVEDGRPVVLKKVRGVLHACCLSRLHATLMISRLALIVTPHTNEAPTQHPLRTNHAPRATADPGHALWRARVVRRPHARQPAALAGRGVCAGDAGGGSIKPCLIV